MKFCSECGNPVSLTIPAGDTHVRHVCDHCGSIHYQNPKIIAGCLPVWDDKILLCRRGIEPRHGLWTLPAGFMENGETVEQGARRETREEACAEVVIDDLCAVYSIPHISQVYMIYRGHLTEAAFSAGDESLEVGLFDESDIPWTEIAFPVITRTLEGFFQDRRHGEFRVQRGRIEPMRPTDS